MSDEGEAMTRKIRELESEKEALRLEIWKHQRKPTGKVGYLLLLLGFSALATSIFAPSNMNYNP